MPNLVSKCPQCSGMFIKEIFSPSGTLHRGGNRRVKSYKAASVLPDSQWNAMSTFTDRKKAIYKPAPDMSVPIVVDKNKWEVLYIE